MASSFHSMHQFHQTNQKDSLAPPSSLFHRPLFRCQPTLPTSSKSYRPSLCPLIKIICLPKNSSLNQTLNKPNTQSSRFIRFSKPQKRTLFLPKPFMETESVAQKPFIKIRSIVFSIDFLQTQKVSISFHTLSSFLRVCYFLILRPLFSSTTSLLCPYLFSVLLLLVCFFARNEKETTLSLIESGDLIETSVWSFKLILTSLPTQHHFG